MYPGLAVYYNFFESLDVDTYVYPMCAVLRNAPSLGELSERHFTDSGCPVLSNGSMLAVLSREECLPYPFEVMSLLKGVPTRLENQAWIARRTFFWGCVHMAGSSYV